MSKYEPFGPFKIERNGKLVDQRKKKKFWDDIERQAPGLPGAVGCYIFAIHAGKGVRPWYVGKTEKGNFKGETWSPHKLNIYNEAINQKRGTPQTIFDRKKNERRQVREAKERRYRGDSRLGKPANRYLPPSDQQAAECEADKTSQADCSAGLHEREARRALHISEEPRETSPHVIATPENVYVGA